MQRSWFPVVAVALILLVSACQGPASYEPVPGVNVHHYDVDLELAPEARSIRGSTTIHVTHPDTLETLAFSFGSGMRVDSVMVDDRTVEITHRRGWLDVPASVQAGPGPSRVTVAYSGWPSEGIYSETHGDQVVVYSDGWPDRVRGWIPGAHHPADAATATLSLTMPASYHLEGSGQLVERDTLDDQIRSTFSLSVPVPTYSLAFAAGRYVEVADTAAWNEYRWPVRYLMLEDDASDTERLSHLPGALAHFSELIGPYPFDDYATVQVPFRYAGMENAATSFIRADLFRSTASGSLDFHAAEVVAVHELAHQWFGNYVSLAEWRDLWLSEGMATYLTTLYYEHSDGEEAAHALRTELARVDGSWRRGQEPLVPGEEVAPRDHLSPATYNKGAAVLHLLRLRIGDDAFFRGLRTIYRSHGRRPLSTKAFREAMEQQSGLDLASFFNEWVYGTELPVLQTSWDAEARTLRWALDEPNAWIEESPVLLELMQDERRTYVALGEQEAILEDETTPTVTPVGVMIRIR